MSKSAYLYDEGDHNGPHLMFFTALKDGKNWGLAHRARQLFPVLTGSYRRRNRPRRKGCRPILVFAVEVAKWSDGTAAPLHQE